MGNQSAAVSASTTRSVRRQPHWLADFEAPRAMQWSSVWHQTREILLLEDVESVLEIGIGRGLTKALLEHFGRRHVGLDLQEQFEPDLLMKFDDFESDERFDLVCAFQMLEHIPQETLSAHLRRMAMYSRKYVFISVPYSGRWFSVQLAVNWWRWVFDWTWCRCFSRAKPKVRPLDEYRKRTDSHNPHWWEVGDRDLPKEAMRSLIGQCGLRIVKEFHNPQFPYHLFYLMEKTNQA